MRSALVPSDGAPYGTARRAVQCGAGAVLGAPAKGGMGVVGGHGELRLLMCRVLSHVCALPLEHVVETMRPLPVERIAGAPELVRGLAVVRGVAVPVVDAARLLGGDEAHGAEPGRFVIVRAAERRVALAVESVVGVRQVDATDLHALPPLFGDEKGHVVSAIGTMDAELLLVLRSMRLVPDAAWASLEATP